jgi:type I restriction enzyme S subunit
LRVANVQRGQLDLEEMKEIELLESEIEKYRLHDGDVVLTEGGDWDKLGRSTIWMNQIELCVHQNHVFRAPVKDSDMLPEWLMYFTNSEVGCKSLFRKLIW